MTKAQALTDAFNRMVKSERWGAMEDHQRSDYERRYKEALGVIAAQEQQTQETNSLDHQQLVPRASSHEIAQKFNQVRSESPKWRAMTPEQQAAYTDKARHAHRIALRREGADQVPDTKLMVQQETMQHFMPPEEEKRMAEFGLGTVGKSLGKSLLRAPGNLGSTLVAAGGVGADLLGKGMKAVGLDRAGSAVSDVGQGAINVGNMMDAWNKYYIPPEQSGPRNLQEFGDMTTGQKAVFLMDQIPEQVATMFLPGMLGAKAAQAAVAGAKGAKAAGVLKPLTGYLARKGPQSAQALGALVGSTVQSASEIGKSQMQEAGDTNALATLIAAPVAGKLESLVPASAEWLSGAFKGASRKAFTEAMKSPVKFLGHISKEMLKSGSTEAATELLQESIQMYATEMAKDERGAGILDAAGTAIDILREKGIDGLIAEAKRNEAVGELAMAALLGGVAGGVFEGAGRTFAGARYLGSPVRHYDALISASTDEEKRAAANAWEKLTPLQRQQAREEAVYRSIFELDDPESDHATVDEALKVLRGIGHNEAQQYYATMAKSGWAPNEKHQDHLLDLWGKKNIEPVTPQAPISPDLASKSEGSGEQAAVMTSTEDTAPVMPTPLPEESRTPDDKTSLRPEDAASALETQGHIASDGLSGLRGKKTKIRTPQGYEVDGEYRIVEADEGRNSFGEGYTSELQDRDTRKEDSRYQIEKIRDHVIPGELLPDFEGADIGAPIMGLNAADNQLEVEIGNHRDQAIREGYRHGTFDSYKQTLIDRAAIFGFDPDEVAKMRSPKLVRVRTTALDRENRKAFANSGNKPRSRVKNSAEKALTDAQYIAPALESLVVTADGDFNTAGNREFLREFIRAVAPTIEEQGDLIKDGALTQSGVNRVRNAIFAAAYGNASLVERLAENTDERIKRILSGMTSAAASTAVVRNEIAKGNLHDLQIADDVGKAADKLAELRKNGTSVDQYLSQGLFFDDGMTPESKLLLKIADKAKNIRVFADLITGFNGQVKALGDPKQGTLFEGQQLPTKLSLLEAVIERDYPELAAIKETVKKGQAIHEHQLNSDDAVKSSPESAYFSPTPEAQRIELARIRPGKQEESQSIANAKNFMQAAAAGQGDKRAPIDLVENDDGTYTVIDGNATAHAMNELGGSHVLAQVRGKNTGTRLGNSALIVKRQSPAGTLRADSIDRQNTEVGMNQLYQLAEENNPGLTELVNAAAKQSGGKAVMRPKIKDRTRVSEKAVKDYAGDAGRVTDVIGGTIVLPDTGDFNDAIKAIRKSGAEIVRVTPPKNKTGYKDVKAIVKFPNGGLGEIILVSEFMLNAKQNRGGHEVYDVFRILEKYESAGNKEINSALADLKLLTDAIYDRDAALSNEDFERAKAKASSSVTRLLSGTNPFLSSQDIPSVKSSLPGLYLASPSPSSSYAMPNLSLIQNDMGTSGSSVENSPSHTSIIPDSEVSDNNNIDQNPSIDNDNQNQPEVKLSKQQSTEPINPEVERIAKLLDQLTDSKAAPKSQYEELVQLIEKMTSSPSESVQAGSETQYEKVARLVEQLGGPAATSDSQQQAQLSKGSDQTQAMPREELDALADRIQNNLDSMHDIRIVPVESTQELSAKLKQEIPATVEGALVGKTVYLVRENLPDAKRATEVAGHEIIGHYGLPGILGREYQGFQKDFVNLAASDRSIADELKRAVRDYRGDKGMSDSRIIDEAIARTAERYAADPQGVSERARQWLDNLIAKVRDTLRVLGFDIKFDTRDLAQTIRASKSAVTRDDSFNSKSSGTELDGYEELAEETPARGRLDHLVEQIGEELPAQHKETGNKLLDILLALGEDDSTEGSQTLFSRKKAQGKVAGSPEQRTLVDLLNELDGIYSKTSTVEAKAIFEETKNTFGLTDSLSEAGYVLPDGSMLDFSGRHEGYGESGERTVDHRDIDWTDAPGSANDRMTEFMRQGAIRVDGDSGIISVHGRNEITPAQKRVLRKITDLHDTVWLDLEDDSGNRAGLEVRGGWKKVEGTLNRWQAGTTPKTGVMFSRGGQSQSEQLTQTPKSQLEQILDSLPDDTQSQQTKSKLEEILDALPGNDDTSFSKAYHGSPHRGIEKEGFKLNKIGSGEGNQAYGWGMYFAGNRNVAEDYRKRLADWGSSGSYTFEGRQFQSDDYTSPERHAISHAYHNGVNAARKLARDILADAKAGKPHAMELGGIEYAQKMLDTANTIKRKTDITFEQGQLYSAEIPDSHELLDWDKSLSEQPEGVREAIQEAVELLKEDGWPGDQVHDPLYELNAAIRNNGSGKDIYHALQDIAFDRTKFQVSEDAPRHASEFLQSVGIPGLQYLDGNSRRQGEGTHNYVIWDESRLNDDIQTFYSKKQSGENSQFSLGNRLKDIEQNFPADDVEPIRLSPKIKDVRGHVTDLIYSWPQTIEAADGSQILLHSPEHGSIRDRAWHLVRDVNTQKPDDSKLAWVSNIPATLENATIRMIDPKNNNRLYVRGYRGGDKHIVVVSPDGVVEAHSAFNGSLITQFKYQPGSRQSRMIIDWANSSKIKAGEAPEPSRLHSEDLEGAQESGNESELIDSRTAGESPSDLNISDSDDDVKFSKTSNDQSDPFDPSPEPLPTLTEETRAQAGKVTSAMQQLASGLLGKTMSQRDRDDAAFQRAQAINPEADTNYELTESGKIDEAVKTSAYQDATILSHLDADKNLITAMIRKLTPEGDLQDWLLKKAARVLAPYQAGKPIERLLFTVGENVAWDGEKIVESPGIRTYNQETGEYEYTEGQHTKAAMHFFNTLSPEWKELMTKRAQANEEYRQHFVDVVVPHRKAQVAIALLARYRQMNADKSALEGAEAEARSMLTALDGKINKAEHNELKALLENVVKIPADRVAKMVVSLESIIRQATGELKTPAQLQRELKLLNSNRGHYGYVHHFFENDPTPSPGRAFDAFGRVPNGWIEDVPGSQKLRTGAEGYERNLLKADLARKGKEVKSEVANNWMRQVEDQRGLLVEEFQEADFMPEGYEARQRVVANFGKYRGQEIYLPDNIYDHYKLVKQNGLQDPGMKEFSEIVQMVDGFTNRVNEALLFHPGKFARDLISVPFHLMEFVRDWSVKNPLEAPFMVMALTRAIGKSMTPETWQKNTPESFGEYSESQVYQNKDGDKSFLTKAGDAAGRLFMPGVPLGSTVAAFLRELNLSGSADLPIKRIMKSVGEQIADRRGLKGKARERFVFDMINDYAFITSDLPFMLSYLRGQRPTKGSKAWGAFMRTTIPFLGYSSRMVKQMVADPVSKGILPMAKRLVGKQGADANFLHEFSEASRPFAWLFLKSLVSAGLGGLIPPEKEGLASEVQNAKWLDPTARTHGRILISQDEDPKGGEYWMSTDGYGQLQVADLLDQITRGKTTVKDFATEFFTIHPTMQFLMGQLGIEDAYSAKIPVTAKLGRVIAQAMIPQLTRFGPELAKFFRAVAGNNTIPDAKKQNFFTGFFEQLGIPAGEVKVDRDGKLRVSKNGIEALKMAGVNIRHIPYDMIAEAAEGELSGIDYLAKRLEMIQEYRDGDRDSDLSEREFIAQTLKTDRWSNLDDASRDITEELVERGHGTLATIAKLRKKGVPITERKKPAQKKSSQFGGGFKNTFGSGFSSGFGRKPSQLSAEEKYEKKVLTAEEIIKSIEVETAKQPKGWREQLGEWINKL